MADEKPRTQKVTLVNTGTNPFVVTDSQGRYVEIPPAPPENKPPEPPPEPIKPKIEGAEHPVNEVEVELDEGTLNALKQRQEAGSPLHVGGGGGHKPANPQPHAPQHEEPPKRR